MNVRDIVVAGPQSLGSRDREMGRKTPRKDARSIMAMHSHRLCHVGNGAPKTKFKEASSEVVVTFHIPCGKSSHISNRTEKAMAAAAKRELSCWMFRACPGTTCGSVLTCTCVDHAALFTPIRIGGREAKNRIVMAPMTRARAGPRYLSANRCVSIGPARWRCAVCSPTRSWKFITPRHVQPRCALCAAPI